MPFPSSVMHLKKFDRNHYILFFTLFAMIIDRNLVSCKPIMATEEIVVDDEVDAITTEPVSNIRIDTLVKATEAVQQFQKMLNEQVLTLENDEIIVSTDVALTILPDQQHSTTVGTTAEPHLHKHRHSKSHHRDGYHHHRRKDNGDDSSITEQIFDDDHQLRETQRRFNSRTNFVANPYGKWSNFFSLLSKFVSLNLTSGFIFCNINLVREVLFLFCNVRFNSPNERFCNFFKR